jgi:hypothetical protein
MEGSVRLGPAERKRVMEVYRGHPDPKVRQRARIVLLSPDGWRWSCLVSALYCSRGVTRSRSSDTWRTCGHGKKEPRAATPQKVHTARTSLRSHREKSLGGEESNYP